MSPTVRFCVDRIPSARNELVPIRAMSFVTLAPLRTKLPGPNSWSVPVFTGAVCVAELPAPTTPPAWPILRTIVLLALPPSAPSRTMFRQASRVSVAAVLQLMPLVTMMSPAAFGVTVPNPGLPVEAPVV